jgi:signal transduction histidine kinase
VTDRPTDASVDRIAGDAKVPLVRGLSARLLMLTILFVLLAEVLIFVPSIANFRINWLQDRLDTAGAASIVVSQIDTAQLPQTVQDDLLMATGADAIVLKGTDASRIIAMSSMPPSVAGQYDLRDMNAIGAISDAIGTLVAGGEQKLRVVGNIGGSDQVIELVMSDKSLRTAMWTYARNVAILSLLISLITASLIFFAINRMMIRPIRAMTRSMLVFAQVPDDRSNIIQTSGRTDEFGVAERELAAMQDQIHQTLSQRKHLAELGLAVSKINHDMRNILATAQLMSDRLAGANDPVVQRIGPKLVKTLDRAVSYSSAVLAYGGAKEAPPARRQLALRTLVEDVYALSGAEFADGIEFVNAVEDNHVIDADPDQLFRVLNNLVRNALQALDANKDPALMRRISISASRMGSVSEIRIMDSGPGLPPVARDNLFAAFKGSARQGGTGLGLAIAHELVRVHGGEIRLVESVSGRTVFAFTVPDRPVILDDMRTRRALG